MTSSIVARSADGESWGVAVASKFLAVGAVVPAAVAQVGALATQADANVAYKGQALFHLDEGATAPVALQRLLEEDDGRDHRQVGLVDLDGGSASHTGQACIVAGSAARSSGARAAGSCCSRLSHAAQASGGRITGMRSWIGAISAFGAVVMTQQVSSQSAASHASGERHASNRPAKANGGAPLSPPLGLMYQGCLTPPTLCHS